MKRIYSSNLDKKVQVAETIMDKFGSSNPGPGCSFIARNGQFINIYPELDVHEDLCYWVEDNLDYPIDYPDEEWAISEYGWIRLRKDPSMIIVELPDIAPSQSQWYSLQDWLEYVESSSNPGVSIYLNAYNGNDGDIEYSLGTEYFAEDIVKLCRRYYSSGRLYASMQIVSSDLTHLFSVGQKVSCRMDDELCPGVVVATEPDHIIVDIPGVSDHCWFDDDMLGDVYPDYNL